MKGLSFGVMGMDHQERIDFARMRRERLSGTQAVMKKYGLAAWLLSRPDSIRYVTGIKGPMFAPGLRYAICFAEHEPIMYELGDILEHNKVHCPWIKAENWRYAYSWLDGIPGAKASVDKARQWAYVIARDLKEKGLHKEKLGFDVLDGIGMQALKEAGVEIVPMWPAQLEARRIKTIDEISCLKMVAKIVDAGFYAVCETSRPGRTDADVVAAILAALTKAGAEMASADYRSGPNTFEVYHDPPLDRIIQVGDLQQARLCNTRYMGYMACVYRTFIVGRKPNQKEKDFYKRCYERVYSVIEEIRPGATTADAAKRFLPASTWGYEADDRLLVSEVGHGIGLTLGYDEPVISRVFSFEHPQPFEPGMVIAVEAREGESGYGGVRLEEMVVVTETGHEIITTWPAEEIVEVGAIL